MHKPTTCFIIILCYSFNIVNISNITYLNPLSVTINLTSSSSSGSAHFIWNKDRPSSRLILHQQQINGVWIFNIKATDIQSVLEECIKIIVQFAVRKHVSYPSNNEKNFYQLGSDDERFYRIITYKVNNTEVVISQSVTNVWSQYIHQPLAFYLLFPLICQN